MSLVLVTRAEPGASETAARLTALGLTPVLAPMLEIRPRADGLEADGAQALLLTSPNGARALAETDLKRTLPVLAVGDATAEAARAAGFTDVRSAAGDAGDLAALARAAFDPAAGPLLWASGADISQDLAALLAPAGFGVRRAIVYAAEPATALPATAAEAIRAGRVAAVLFHSARAAEVFAALARGAGLTDAAGDIRAVCISPRVAAAAQQLFGARCVTAKTPEEAGLLDALTRAPGASGA